MSLLWSKPLHSTTPGAAQRVAKSALPASTSSAGGAASAEPESCATVAPASGRTPADPSGGLPAAASEGLPEPPEPPPSVVAAPLSARTPAPGSSSKEQPIDSAVTTAIEIQQHRAGVEHGDRKSEAFMLL